MKNLQDKELLELDNEYSDLYVYLEQKLGKDVNKLNQILEIEVELTLRGNN